MPYVTTQLLDGCSKIRISNTDANLLTIDVIRELAEAFHASSQSTKAILLCGGDRFFSNGLDVNWALTRSGDQMREMFLTLGDLVLQILETPVPVVGVIKGHAIGAAKTLFCACDYRYAATGRVLIGVPEILLGVPNPYFADQLLRFIAGDQLASDLIYTGRLITAEDGVPAGLVHHTADKATIEDDAWKKTVALAALSGTAFAECKSMRVAELCASIRRNLSARTDKLIEIWDGAEAQRRLKAAAQRLAK
ncbi:MAG: enoyl-CoA hydratase/isomerase family protein [Rhodopseudomonas sp.]|uniref:enoyl-CoA hydratase/isomerase family protein n=1 Tax=Rhodopseudomonas sp. TaxID=1078 RepID=UPI0017CD0D7E|nr:enoyl-CoA hydratase/isomerase family protein [Rhodopseudomonas sp.]NVN87607.1 enoyl-CoA hydratase/isomerase family protein [Rhodopseudomonas sp.]